MLNNKLHCLFQNARSLKSVNRDNNELANLRLLQASNKPNVLSIVETWLDDTVFDSELHVDGYQCCRRDRGSSGGGVAVYIKSEFVSVCRTDLLPSSPNFNEILVCELVTHAGPIFLVTFYRPPNADQTFNDNLTRVLDNIKGIKPNSKMSTCLTSSGNP